MASLVSRLRKALGPDRIVGGRGGYRFETAGCRVDVDDAERLVREAESQLRGGRAALGNAASAQALQLLEQGQLLEDEPYALWASDARREAERLLRRPAGRRGPPRCRSASIAAPCGTPTTSRSRSSAAP
jgi:DNA-binding SARP family transcriptional activator